MNGELEGMFKETIFT